MGLIRSHSLILIGLASMVILSCSKHDPSAVNVIKMGLQGSSVGTAIVREEDNVSVIAERYKLPMESIIATNNLKSPYRIYPNQRLILSPPRTYTVKRGDTLYHISRMFSTTQTAIVRLNAIQKPYHIREGQILRMPMPEQTILSAKPQPPSVRKMKNNPMAKVPKLGGNGRFSVPVQGKIISSYGSKEGGLHNDGINISAKRASVIGAAQDGVVAYVGDAIEGYGNLVLLRHDQGYITAYAHMDSVLVKRGDNVRKMQPIGTVGSTGNVSTPQLHFEIRKGTKALNPAVYL